MVLPCVIYYLNSFFDVITTIHFFWFIVPPTTVQIKIADINAPQEYNVKMADQADVAVECIAEEARPPPKFTWFLGEDPLNVRIANKNYFAYIIFLLCIWHFVYKQNIFSIFYREKLAQVLRTKIVARRTTSKHLNISPVKSMMEKL